MENKEFVTENIALMDNNIEILRKYFSHCFDKSGNFDFDKFKEDLESSEIDFFKESYGLDWLGKSYARLLATDSARTLLKESKEWNDRDENKNSENILIKGDNLEVLKHLSNAYHEKIKMIYIDPPYNTGNDGFVYEDDRKFTVEEFSELAGVNRDRAKKILNFVTSKNNSHSAWLTFMYPRLYIAKSLLREDGVIFISIDDNEVAQLRILMDEIFGEENFVGEIIWNSKYTTSNDAKFLSSQHENILFYTKNKDNFNIGLLPRTEKQNKDYKNRDNDPKGPWKATPLHAKSGSENNNYSITFSNGKIWTSPDGRYPRYSKEKLQELYDLGELYFNSNGGIDKKTYLSEVKDGLTIGSLWNYDDVGHTHSNNEELAELIGKGMFNNPKGTKLIKRILIVSNTNQNDLILDFFAGSGTTGDAVMQLNSEDGGNRKYILVQIPEEIDKKKSKTAYDFVKNDLNIENPTIFEITKERLIRASKKISETVNSKILQNEKEIKSQEIKSQEKRLNFDENNGDIQDLKGEIDQLKEEINSLKQIDLGFKIFETIPIWDNYNFEEREINPYRELFDSDKLSSDDLQTILTTWKTYDNIPLTKRLKEVKFNNYIGYYSENRVYLINKGFKTENLKLLIEKIDEDKDFNPTTITVLGYNFESKTLREISENLSIFTNKKSIDIDFIIRY